MITDIIFVRIIGKIYQPFFLMKINFIIKALRCWKIQWMTLVGMSSRTYIKMPPPFPFQSNLKGVW